MAILPKTNRYDKNKNEHEYEETIKVEPNPICKQQIGKLHKLLANVQILTLLIPKQVRNNWWRL